MLVPNLVHGSGQGAAVPAIPIAAYNISGSFATAAMVGAVLTLGQLVFALPAGWFVSRYGEKAAMIVSAVVTAAGAVAASFAASLPVLVVSVFLMGSGVAVFTMARHVWVTIAVSVEVRGRALALVAGSHRLGMLVGPFLAAGAFAVTQEVDSAFVVVAVTSLLIVLVVAFISFPAGRAPEGAEEAPRVLTTLWQQRGVLVRLGLVASIVSTMRTTRRIVVPLAGVALGLSDVTIALIVGFAAAIDFSLFYVGGLMTDRIGRLRVALPALIGFGLSYLVIATAGYLPGSTTWFVVAAMVMGVGNGISSGLVATMGSDLADPRHPAAFLSSWRLVSEVGPSLAPVAVAGLTAALSLGAACAALGALAMYGAAVLPRYARRYLPAAVR